VLIIKHLAYKFAYNMKRAIFTLFIVCIISMLHAQSTFEYLYSSSLNELTVSLAEDDEGNIFFPVINYQYGLIIKLDQEGMLIDSLNLHNPNGTCVLGSLIKIDTAQIVALGYWTVDTVSQLWFLKFGKNLEIIQDIKLGSNNCLISDFQCIINHNGNIVFTAHYLAPQSEIDVCMYEITTEGEIINSKFYNTPLIFNISTSLIENNNDSTYKVFSTGPLDTVSERMRCIINLVDTNFSLLDYGSISNPHLNTRATAKLLNESLYLLAGRWLIESLEEWDIGILKVTLEDSVLKSASFGKQDTVDLPGNYKCLDFISPNNIFFVGSTNANSLLFQDDTSWIMLNILDSNLNLNSQQFYGGDAYYIVNAVLATQDSGCVMACSRYDYLTQYNEFDVYILKVNKDGLLVSVPENPIINDEPCFIYPNPGNEAFHVNSSTENLLLQIFDMTGKMQMEFPIEKGDNLVQVSALPAGIFLYRIIDSKNQLIQAGKWVKQL
jgi:hypothetical protein